MNIRSSEEFISRRSPVVGTGGAVASSQPLATLAGIEVLREGGAAADAAVAVAAALQVTQPCSTGLGGDCFCLYYERETGKVHALNGSGRSPAALSIDLVRQQGLLPQLPPFHPHTVTVPGAPAAWEEVATRFGRFSLSQSLARAIALAEKGFPVSPLTSAWWQRGASAQLSGHEHGAELMIDGRGPNPGEIFRNPHLARSLRVLADEGSKPFYSGHVAERIVKVLQDEGGVMSMQDLASHRSEWVDPISIDYRGTRVWECPPNGQGLAALIALNILRKFELKEPESRSGARYHLLAECMRLAFADAAQVIADPDFASIPVAELLSEAYGKERAALIDVKRRTASATPGRYSMPTAGDDTVYFSVADSDGNGCSFINSNYMGFGTGIVPEGCGYSLQNRGAGFALDPTHRNALAPGKRPYHTIIPGLATNSDDGSLVAVFGVMGGMMQPQGHLQVVSALVDDRLDPQAALDKPRFQLEGGSPDGVVLVEDSAGEEVHHALRSRGHEVKVVSGQPRSGFGLGQIITARADQVLWAGSDPRGDGCALAIA